MCGGAEGSSEEVSLQSDLEPFRISLEPMPLRLVEPFRIARGTETVRENVLVRVSLSGREGAGEASPNLRYGETLESVCQAIETAAERMGQTRPELPALQRAMDSCFTSEQNAARAGLEMALVDLLARWSGLPAHQLLWLEAPEPIETSFTIAIAEPAEMARRAGEARQFQVLKVKVGDGPSLAGLEAIRRARPDARIRVDANEGWDLFQALAAMPLLKELAVEFLEQPLAGSAPAEEWDRLRQEGIPIFADESLTSMADLERVAPHVDGVNVKVAKLGGMERCRDVLQRARALGLKTMLGCMIESSLGIASALELASLADYADLDGHLLIRDDPFQGHQTAKGSLTRGTSTGLGVEPRTG